MKDMDLNIMHSFSFIVALGFVGKKAPKHQCLFLSFVERIDPFPFTQTRSS